MMKKFFCLLLAMLSLGLLVSCNNGENSSGEGKNYVFVSGSVTVRLDEPAEAILNALGDPLQYDESPSCAFNGLDKVYVYAGFKIQTYPLEGKDYIYLVELTDDSVTTPEGVTIGSTKEQVSAAYGTPNVENSGSLVYTDSENSTSLQFLLRDGRVTNIQYLRTE